MLTLLCKTESLHRSRIIIITISLEVCVPISHTQSPNLHSPNHCPREASLLKLQQQLPTPRCEVRWFHPGLKRSGLAQSGSVWLMSISGCVTVSFSPISAWTATSTLLTAFPSFPLAIFLRGWANHFLTVSAMRLSHWLVRSSGPLLQFPWRFQCFPRC